MAELGALLFDLDGTLADTAEANYLAYAEALGEVGVPIERALFDREAFGRNWRQFLPSLLAAAGNGADPAAVAARKRLLYPGHVGALRLNQGLMALIRGSRPGVKTGLVTSASRQSVDTILEVHSLADLFDTVVTGDDVVHHKPDPEAYSLAAQRLAIPPAHCLAFEDSDVGAQAARAAGIPTIRVVLDA